LICVCVAYLYYPLCWPLIPQCVFNDIYWYFAAVSRNCIDWTVIFGNAVSNQCPLDVAQCYNKTSQSYFELSPLTECPAGTILLEAYQQYLPDCSEEPYNYDAPLKPVIVIIESIWPEFTSWLRYTNSPTLKHLRTLGGLEEALNISNSLSSQDQAACFVIAGVSTFGDLIFYGLIAFGIALIAYFVVFLIGAFVTFLLATTMVLVTPLVEFAGTDSMNEIESDQKRKYVNEGDIGNENASSNRRRINRVQDSFLEISAFGSSKRIIDIVSQLSSKVK